MDDSISRQAAVDAFDGEITVTGSENAVGVCSYVNLVLDRIKRLPSAEPEIIRCKDCKHRPSGTGVNHDLEFPHGDYKCPCRCEDYWYSWKPADDWYCANGERRLDI